MLSICNKDVMNRKILTIVIPVYNVEKYIRQCMDSVIVPYEQMEQLEIIVVNDGTPDNSAVIAYQYAEKYPGIIKVIDKENGGHGSAWNVGLNLASGKYIRFLDSDDWLSNLSDFIAKLKMLDADLFFTHLTKHYENTGEQKTDYLSGVEYDKILSIDMLPDTVLKSRKDMFNFHRCTYRTDILKEDQPLFCERVYYDDSILFIAPLILGKSLCFLDMPLYNWRLSRGGQTMDKTVEKIHAYDYVHVFRGIADFIIKYPQISENQKSLRNKILNAYITDRFRMFTSLPYLKYRSVMKGWLAIVSDIPYIKLSPIMYLFMRFPLFVSYLFSRLSHFWRKVVYHIKVFVWKIIHIRLFNIINNRSISILF